MLHQHHWRSRSWSTFTLCTKKKGVRKMTAFFSLLNCLVLCSLHIIIQSGYANIAGVQMKHCCLSTVSRRTFRILIRLLGDGHFEQCLESVCEWLYPLWLWQFTSVHGIHLLMYGSVQLMPSPRYLLWTVRPMPRPWKR